MSRHVDVSLPATPLGALLAREITRADAQALVEALIEALDALDAPLEDLEPEEDADATQDDPRGEHVDEDDDPLGHLEEPRSRMVGPAI